MPIRTDVPLSDQQIEHRDPAVDDTADPSTLPIRAREKIAAIKRNRNDARAMSSVADNRRYELTEQLALSEQRLRSLKMPSSRLVSHVSRDGRFVGPPSSEVIAELDDDDYRVREARAQIARLENELRHATELSEVRAGRWQALSALVRNLERYISNLGGGRIEAHHVEVVPPKLAKNGTLIDAIETCRRRTREIKADVHTVRSAPYQSALVKARLKVYLDTVAERTFINGFMEAVELGAVGGIELPTQQQTVHSTTGTPDASGRMQPGSGIAVISTPDLLSALVWLDRAKVERRLHGEIDALADDNAALGIEAREQRLSALADDLLATEREEECLIGQAEAAGQMINRRSDCDPRAVLGLASSMPGPATKE